MKPLTYEERKRLAEAAARGGAVEYVPGPEWDAVYQKIRMSWAYKGLLGDKKR